MQIWKTNIIMRYFSNDCDKVLFFIIWIHLTVCSPERPKPWIKPLTTFWLPDWSDTEPRQTCTMHNEYGDDGIGWICRYWTVMNDDCNGWWWMAMVFSTGATSSGLKTTDRLVRTRAMSFGPANTRVLRCSYVSLYHVIWCVCETHKFMSRLHYRR